MKARHLGPVAVALGLSLLVAAPYLPTAPEAHAQVSDAFPQIKINHVDTTAAPLIKVYASFLDSRLRPVDHEKFLQELKVSRKPDKQKAVELFSIVDGEPVFPKTDAGEDKEVPKEELPTLATMGDDERGMAVAVVLPGYASPDYRDGTLGERQRNGAGLFFKKLGKANLMNVVWYNDFVMTWVEAKGRVKELTRLEQMADKCAAWELEQLETWGEPPPEGDDPAQLADDEAYCGLTANYADLPKVITATTYQGFYPHLFGLGAPLCNPTPQHERMSTSARAAEASALGAPAVEVALRMLAKDGKPGQPKALVLLGDGRDGYAYRLEDCRAKMREDCNREILEARKAKRAGRHDEDEEMKLYRDSKTCVDKKLGDAIKAEQARFEPLLKQWLSLAKAAGIRIFTVVNPNAEPHERERLELLAWRSGGTARVAEDANVVADHYTDLIDELNGQLVVTFTDHEATPGSMVAYELEVKAAGRKFAAPAYAAAVPKGPEGVAVMVDQVRSMGEAKLGKKGFMAVAIGVGLVLALILLKLLMAIGKKIFGKGAKAAQGAGKGAAGLAKKGAGAGKAVKKLGVK